MVTTVAISIVRVAMSTAVTTVTPHAPINNV